MSENTGLNAAGLGSEVLASAIAEFHRNKDLADRASSQLTDAQLRHPLDANTNSVAVIMKHVAGNLLSRWTDFLTTDGEKPARDRDKEFIDDFPDRAAILAYWERGWSCLFGEMAALKSEDLARTVLIRGEPHTVPLAIDRSLAHCAYHSGQIVLTARLLAGNSWTTLTVPRGGSRAFNEAMGYRPR